MIITFFMLLPPQFSFVRRKKQQEGFLLNLQTFITAGEMMWRDESFNMKTLLSEVVSMMSYQAAEHGIMLRLGNDNGIDLLEWMRSNGYQNPFIIMTSYDESMSAVRQCLICFIFFVRFLFK